MKLYFLIVTLLLTLTGCSEKSTAFDFFKFDHNYERAISYTKTVSVMHSMETSAIISTVYLNKVLAQEYNSSKESFFVAVYINDGKNFYSRKRSIKPEYKLTLNDKEPITFKPLKKDSKLRKLMPIKSEWNEYYLIEFEAVEENAFDLHFFNDENQSVNISYVHDDS